MDRCKRKSAWYHNVSGKRCPTCKGTGHGTVIDPVTKKEVDHGACPTCRGFGKVAN